MRQAEFEVGPVRNEKGDTLDVVQPNARVVMELPPGSQVGDMLRREKTEK